jgi:DNA-binding NarL/FixJ family response regulator
MEKIKVFLSDPQILFREGIHFILSGEDDFDVIGETTSNEDAYTHIEANQPNIAVLSLLDKTWSGIDATRRIKRSLASIAVILTIEKEDEELLFQAMKSGASACITKDADPEYLLDIIRVVAQGSQPIIDSLLIPGLASRVLVEFEDLATLSNQLGNMLASLLPKEAEVLAGISAGNGIDLLAAKLETNEDGVRKHLRLILNKMVANDQARALIEAAQRSLPSIMHGTNRINDMSEYVTKTEFNEFKESLTARLKSFIGELA